MSVFYKKNIMVMLLSMILVCAIGCGQGNAESLEVNQEAENVQEEVNTQQTAGEPSTEVKENSDENICNFYEVSEGISAEEYENFKVTADAVDAQGYNKFDDFADIMNRDFTGTWYDPEMGEAIRLTKEAAYVYIPFLDEYGDVPYEWEVIDRSDRNLCPELAIYISGRGAGPLAYYVGGFREDYFWCNSQMQTFYRQ